MQGLPERLQHEEVCHSDDQLTGLAYFLWDELEGAYVGRWMRYAGMVEVAGDHPDELVLSRVARRWALAVKPFCDLSDDGEMLLPTADVHSALDIVINQRSNKQYVPQIPDLNDALNQAKRLREQEENYEKERLQRLHRPARTPRDIAAAKKALAAAYRMVGDVETAQRLSGECA